MVVQVSDVAGRWRTLRTKPSKSSPVTSDVSDPSVKDVNSIKSATGVAATQSFD